MIRRKGAGGLDRGRRQGQEDENKGKKRSVTLIINIMIMCTYHEYSI